MGAEFFEVKSDGKSAAVAFEKAVRSAQYDYGHAGYTGSIAEKSKFLMIEVPEGIDVHDYVEELWDECDERIDDKWGPAGCIDLKNGEYLFFGWASS
jgi:hypothetical protein